MNQSSNGVDVKAANSKLAQFLRRQEEEEMLLQIGKRKPKELPEANDLSSAHQPKGRAKWSAPVDFKVPSPMIDRPRTTDGATSFHFSYITVSKTAVPTVAGKPLDPLVAKAQHPALAHSQYIERDGAAEVSAGAQHSAYVEREEAVEHTLSGAYKESLNQDEEVFLGPQVQNTSSAPSIFSNISDDKFEREEFWRAVERSESNPKTHQLYLNPETSPKWWAALVNTNMLDPTFKNHALLVAEKYRQHLISANQPDGPKLPFKPEPYTVSSDRAGVLIKQARTMAGYDYSQPPIEFKSGRGGRVQTRFVAELPHEISAEDRALIVQNFCDKLSSLEERVDSNGNRVKTGMMYTAVIHAPDAHNDSRNYHLHIVAHDRPAKFIDDLGCWDFEYKEHFQVRGMTRHRFPLRQDKIGSVSQGTNKTGRKNSGVDFIPSMRSEFAKITNAVLKARGIKRHYDPRTYKAMGIDRTPTDHLGTNAAALEAIGVTTAVGHINAIAIWNDAARAIKRATKQREKDYKNSQVQLIDLTTLATRHGVSSPELDQLRKHIAARDKMITGLSEDRREIMTFDHLEAKAKSRAVRTRQTCLQLLADIANGNADAPLRMVKKDVEKRWKEAQQHIDAIDIQLAPHREGLRIAAAEIERREQYIKFLNSEIEPLKKAILKTIDDRKFQAPRRDARPGHSVHASPAGEAQTSSAETAQILPDHSGSMALSSPSASGDVGGSGAINNQSENSKKPVAPDMRAAGDVHQNSIENDDADKGTRIAELQPATIQGLPIVEPTLTPIAVDHVEHHELQFLDTQSQPEGLAPLRPRPITTSPDVVPELIVPDISVEAQQAAAAAIEGQNGEPASEGPTKPTEALLEHAKLAGEPSPTLSPSSTNKGVLDQAKSSTESSPPRHASTVGMNPDETAQETPITENDFSISSAQKGNIEASSTDTNDWDQLMNRIATSRIPVKKEEDVNGASTFSVPSLAPSEQALLKLMRFSKRSQARLKGIHEIQSREINRLVRWIAENGSNQDKIIFVNKNAKLGNVTQALRTMMHNWKSHPEIIGALRSANDLNIALEAQRKKQRELDQRRAFLAQPMDNGLTRQEMLEQAAEKYPAPDQVYTHEVQEFTRLLRELAPKEKLIEAAKRIHISSSAREDVNHHTVELATAYSQYIDDVDFRASIIQRNDRGGRG